MSSNIEIIKDSVFAARDLFTSVLADKSILFEKEAAFAVQAIMNNSKAIQVARDNPQSVINAVSNIAAIGISLNPAKKQAYLVPRGNQIILDLSYMGLLDLAQMSGSIRWGQAKIVHLNDKFEMNGIDKEPTHAYEAFASLEKRGAIVGVYCVIKTLDGDYLTETMMVDEVNYIRDNYSQSFQAWRRGDIDQCPWESDWGEMAKKTVIKRGYKYWPKTDRMDTAIHMLNTDGGEGFASGQVEAVPAKKADETGRVDVQLLIREAQATTTDAAALEYWSKNNGRLANQLADHKIFKDAVVAHRVALREKGTVDA